MGCRSNYRRICERPASTLQLMAGSCKKPVQLPVVQLFERVGKVSRQHVSRRQFFGAAHGRSGLLGGCQACRSVSATRLLSAFRLKQIRRLLLRATRWHAANYAACGSGRHMVQTVVAHRRKLPAWDSRDWLSFSEKRLKRQWQSCVDRCHLEIEKNLARPLVLRLEALNVPHGGMRTFPSRLSKIKNN